MGLNPAWQKTLVFNQLRVGEVNRARLVETQASGKGINFAAAARQAGGHATVVQFAGGVTGDWLTADLDRRGLPHATVCSAGATRICSTVLSEADGVTTELIEPSAAVSAGELAELRGRLFGLLLGAAGLGLCGTVPPGVPASFYAEAVAAAEAAGCLVLLDAYREIETVLRAGPDLLKINTAELTALTGTAEPAAAARLCLEQFPIRALAITAGPAAAFLFTRGHGWQFTLPRLEHVLNPIGAGDTAAGVLLWQLAAERAGGEDVWKEGSEVLPDAFRRALACACASCLTREPAAFSLETALDLVPAITVSCL